MSPPSTGLDEAIERAAGLLRAAQRVAVLTGAGVSAESGVPTFRDAGGLWEGHRIEEVATPEAFERDPSLVWRFYNLRRDNLRGVRPNPGHAALAVLERHYGPENFVVITQNIDGLHQAAGSTRVLELHGAIRRVRCSSPHCDVRAEPGLDDLGPLPRCSACGQLLRPDIVWFGEGLPDDVWEAAMVSTYSCQCFLVVGTSAVVYPAAGLARVAASAGATVIEVNPNATDVTHHVDISLQGPSGRILPELLRRLK